MKRLIFAGTLVLIATFAQAQNTASNPNSHPVQAYTTLGPAGAGVYRESPQRNNSATGNVVSHPAPSARENCVTSDHLPDLPSTSIAPLLCSTLTAATPASRRRPSSMSLRLCLLCLPRARGFKPSWRRQSSSARSRYRTSAQPIVVPAALWCAYAECRTIAGPALTSCSSITTSTEDRDYLSFWSTAKK
jgi:hypothetical protein